MVWGFLSAFCLWWVFRGAGRTGHPFRALFCSALGGSAALAAVNALGGYTGVLLPVSPVSCLISGLLGVPGVIAMLLISIV